MAPKPPMTLDELFGLVVHCRSAEEELNKFFLEREEVIRSAILALLTQEHVYQIGAPGTAKSFLIRSLVRILEGARYHETLLNGETSLESLLGKEQVPDAHVVFLDEVFRAPKETLLGLLPILNERIAYLPTPRKVPLLTLFGASNQNPSPADGLDAFYDRFTFRSIVRPIADSGNFQRFLSMEFPETIETGRTLPHSCGKLRLEEFTQSRNAIGKEIRVGKGGMNAMLHLRERFSQEGVWISDRRWKKVLMAARAVAAWSFQDTVEPLHFKDLICVLWTYPTEIRIIERILQEI
ncbi:MAG: AAA family ATPase [Leptospirales bacterium]